MRIIVNNVVQKRRVEEKRIKGVWKVWRAEHFQLQCVATFSGNKRNKSSQSENCQLLTFAQCTIPGWAPLLQAPYLTLHPHPWVSNAARTLSLCSPHTASFPLSCHFRHLCWTLLCWAQGYGEGMMHSAPRSSLSKVCRSVGSETDPAQGATQTSVLLRWRSWVSVPITIRVSSMKSSVMKILSFLCTSFWWISMTDTIHTSQQGKLFLYPDSFRDSWLSYPHTMTPQSRFPSDWCLFPGNPRTWHRVTGARKPPAAHTFRSGCRGWPSWRRGDPGRAVIALQVQGCRTKGMRKECVTAQSQQTDFLWVNEVSYEFLARHRTGCALWTSSLDAERPRHPYLPTPLSQSFLPLSGAQRASGRGDLKTPGGLSAATGDAGRTGLSWTATEVGPARRQPGGVQRSCPWAWWGSMQKHSLCSTCWTCEHLSLSLSHTSLRKFMQILGGLPNPAVGKDKGEDFPWPRNPWLVNSDWSTWGKNIKVSSAGSGNEYAHIHFPPLLLTQKYLRSTCYVLHSECGRGHNCKEITHDH